MKHRLSLFALGAALTVTSGFAQESLFGGGGAVFVMTNSASKNEIVSFQRSWDGTLKQHGRFATGGRGSGGTIDPLQSQGSLTLTANNRVLLAVNAGSGEISSFLIFGNELFLVDKVPCGGAFPNSVAVFGNLVYVENSGGTSSVTGFRVSPFGNLTPIPSSLTYLSTGASGAASLSFSPDGKYLAVSERLTNIVDTFAVQSNGTLAPIVKNTITPPGLFAVQFAPNGAAIAIETGPTGATNGSTISSYTLQPGGILSQTSEAATLGAATCWSAITPNGKFIYTANAGTSSISGFSIGPNGVLSALPGTVVGLNPNGSTNLDIAISADGKFLYTLNAGTGEIGIFGIQQDGTLTSVGTTGSLPAGSGLNGIAAI